MGFWEEVAAENAALKQENERLRLGKAGVERENARLRLALKVMHGSDATVHRVEGPAVILVKAS